MYIIIAERFGLSRDSEKICSKFRFFSKEDESQKHILWKLHAINSFRNETSGYLKLDRPIGLGGNIIGEAIEQIDRLHARQIA